MLPSRSGQPVFRDMLMNAVNQDMLATDIPTFGTTDGCRPLAGLDIEDRGWHPSRHLSSRIRDSKCLAEAQPKSSSIQLPSIRRKVTFGFNTVILPSLRLVTASFQSVLMPYPERDSF